MQDHDPNEDDDTRPDGMGPMGRSPVRQKQIELVDRVARVEERTKENGEKLDSVDDKVDDIREAVQASDKGSVDAEYFEDDVKPDIDDNTRLRQLVTWVGYVLLALSGALASLYVAGVTV